MAKYVEILVPIEQEGTTAVVKNWLIDLGDHVEEGDPIVEIETDKVAMEVQAPCSGKLSEIILQPDENAEPSAVLGRIDAGVNSAPETKPVEQPNVEPTTVDAAKPQQSTSGTERRFSPSVRRILSEANILDATIEGTGRRGRVTKDDAERYVSNLSVAKPVSTTDTHRPSVASEEIPHSTMRRAIANHMSHSVSTAPHVTAVFEADFSAIIKHRSEHKSAFKSAGINLTYTAYFIAACVEAMKAVPQINSQWHDDFVELHHDLNIGIGTALGDDGLIVPVVHDAQSLSLRGIATRLQDITERARNRTLKPQDTQGGTFTISNHGVSGSLVATPIIINQPQSAILGIGKLEKRVCVTEVNGQDTIQILPKAYVSLTIDHRVIDGHQTNAWLTAFVDTIENWKTT